MNMYRNISRLVAGLLLVALPQVGWAQNPRVLELLENDPNGFILTLTAVLVVFSALVLLVVVFLFVGRLMQSFDKGKSKPAAPSAKTEYSTNTPSAKPSAEAMVAIALALDAVKGRPSDEAIVAISMALRAHLEQQHDQESFVLTMNPHRRTSWNARSLGMRQYIH